MKKNYDAGSLVLNSLHVSRRLLVISPDNTPVINQSRCLIDGHEIVHGGLCILHRIRDVRYIIASVQEKSRAAIRRLY